MKWLDMIFTSVTERSAQYRRFLDAGAPIAAVGIIAASAFIPEWGFLIAGILLLAFALVALWAFSIPPRIRKG